MRNNRDRAGRGTFFEELTPLADAIANLPASKAVAGGNVLAERSYEESMRRVDAKNAKLARRAERAKKGEGECTTASGSGPAAPEK